MVLCSLKEHNDAGRLCTLRLCTLGSSLWGRAESMSVFSIVSCPSCQQRNRVPPGAQAHCGRCGAPLTEIVVGPGEQIPADPTKRRGFLEAARARPWLLVWLAAGFGFVVVVSAVVGLLTFWNGLVAPRDQPTRGVKGVRPTDVGALEKCLVDLRCVRHDLGRYENGLSPFDPSTPRDRDRYACLLAPPSATPSDPVRLAAALSACEADLRMERRFADLYRDFFKDSARRRAAREEYAERRTDALISQIPEWDRQERQTKAMEQLAESARARDSRARETEDRPRAEQLGLDPLARFEQQQASKRLAEQEERRTRALEQLAQRRVRCTAEIERHRAGGPVVVTQDCQ